VLLVGGVFLAVRIGEAIVEAREALVRGYSQVRIRRALLESPATAPSLHATRSRWAPTLLFVFALFTANWWWWSYYSPAPFTYVWRLHGNPALSWMKTPIDMIAQFGPLILGRLLTRRALSRDGRGRSIWRRMQGWIGGAVIRLAAWRIPRSSRPDNTAHKTEVVLGNAAESLFARLPTVYRESLQDLPDVVRRLEKHADALRGRRDELEGALAEAGSTRSHIQGTYMDGSAAESLRAHSDAARDALATAHVAAGARLADVIAALEALRLGLLRLRAGVATPADLTSDLELASQVGQQVDALLHGTREANSPDRAGPRSRFLTHEGTER